MADSKKVVCSGPNLSFSQDILVADPEFPLDYEASDIGVVEDDTALEFILVASILDNAPHVITIFHLYPESHQHVAGIIKPVEIL